MCEVKAKFVFIPYEYPVVLATFIENVFLHIELPWHL